MDLAQFDTPAAAREGKWFEVVRCGGRLVALTEAELAGTDAAGRPEWPGAAKTGARLKLASARTEAYRLAMQELYLESSSESLNRQGRRRAAQGKGVPALAPGKVLEIQIEALADHVLLDWSGIESGGQPHPCTPEHKREALKRIDFRDMVSEAAEDDAAFAEAELGNSGSTRGASSS